MNHRRLINRVLARKKREIKERQHRVHKEQRTLRPFVTIRKTRYSLLKHPPGRRCFNCSFRSNRVRGKNIPDFDLSSEEDQEMS